MVRNLMIAGSLVAAFTGHVAVPYTSAALAQPEQTTVVGCLRAGANAGEFVLVDDEQVTYQVQPAEELDLSAHLDHRVELTGTVDKTDDATILIAGALKMVAASCEPRESTVMG